MPHIADLIQAARAVCWAALVELVPELKQLEGRPQHASAGVDVAEHIRRMLVQCPDNVILLLAVLLHDIFKVEEIAEPDSKGGFRYKDHGPKGAPVADAILRRFEGHEQYLAQVVDLVRHHMMPHDGKLPPGFPWPEELIDLAEIDSAGFANRSIGKVRERFNKLRVKFGLPERPFPPPELVSKALDEYLKIHPEIANGTQKA